MIIVVLFTENDTEKVFTNDSQDQAGNKSKGNFCPKFYHPSQLFWQTLGSINFFTVECQHLEFINKSF